jgi:hypothetical protein
MAFASNDFHHLCHILINIVIKVDQSRKVPGCGRGRPLQIGLWKR